MKKARVMSALRGKRQGKDSPVDSWGAMIDSTAAGATAATTTARNEGATTRRSATVVVNFTSMAIAASSALLRHGGDRDEVIGWCEVIV